jgi:transcription elongation GreA/GreB family factor
MNIKQAVYEQCVAMVSQRYRTIENTIRSHQKSLLSETKSSAGDKHETGRAMLQLEMEKAGQLLIATQEMLETLTKINPLKTNALISLGALVTTNIGTYFLSVSAGQIKIKDQVYFAISTFSPIGSIMLGKKEGDLLHWNGRKIEIQALS